MIVNDTNVENTGNNNKTDEDKKYTSSLLMIFKDIKSSRMMKKSEYEQIYNCKVDSNDENGIIIVDRFGDRLWLPMNIIMNNCYFSNHYPNKIKIEIESGPTQNNETLLNTVSRDGLISKMLDDQTK